MKALVTYFSKTGNTEKVAGAIYDALPVDKEIKPILDLEKAEGYDIVFCGFPVHAHSVPGKAQPFVKGLGEGQKVAFFSTHGSLRGGQLPKQAFENAVGLAPKAKVIGHFGCRGKVDPKIIEMLMKQQENKAWAEEAQSADTHPDQADLEDAKAWALSMLGKP
ncbi:MAG: flavodoxin family protein [Pseudomonadota bacterium]